MGKSKLAGIYKLTFPNGKVYIGRSLHVKARLRSHARLENQSIILREACAFYSWDKISHEVIEEYPINETTDMHKLNELLDERERFYIAEYKSNNLDFGYNLADGGKRGKGYHLMDETKRRLSIARKGKKGISRSEETKRKISEKNKGRKPTRECEEARLKAIIGKALSDEHKRKISLNNPKCKRVACYTEGGDLVKVYDSCRDAILDMGSTDKGLIQRVIYGYRKKYKGFAWKYYEE